MTVVRGAVTLAWSGETFTTWRARCGRTFAGPSAELDALEHDGNCPDAAAGRPCWPSGLPRARRSYLPMSDRS